MKSFASVLLIVFAACIYVSSAQRHNVTWGVIGPYDVLLDREILVKKSKFLLVVNEDYTYPRKGFINSYNITGIRCIDAYTNGNGGYATLKKGGPRSNDVTIALKSQRSHGFDFIVEVYGR